VGLVAGTALLSIAAVVVIVKSRVHPAPGSAPTASTALVAAPASATASTEVAAQATAAAAPNPPATTAGAAPVAAQPELSPARTASAPAPAAPPVSPAPPSAPHVPSAPPHAPTQVAPAVHLAAGGPAKPVCSAVPYVDVDGNTHFKQVCR
jgi:hypothetical protein